MPNFFFVQAFNATVILKEMKNTEGKSGTFLFATVRQNPVFLDIHSCFKYTSAFFIKKAPLGEGLNRKSEEKENTI